MWNMSKRLSKIIDSQAEILSRSGDKPGHFKMRYTLAQMEAVYDKAAGKCVICGQEQRGKNLALDHCHTTGRLRGALCTNCNAGLGMFKDRPDLLRAAAVYLDDAASQHNETDSVDIRSE